MKRWRSASLAQLLRRGRESIATASRNSAELDNLGEKHVQLVLLGGKACGFGARAADEGVHGGFMRSESATKQEAYVVAWRSPLTSAYAARILACIGAGKCTKASLSGPLVEVMAAAALERAVAAFCSRVDLV